MAHLRKSHKPRRDIFQEVSQRILESLEKSIIPWRRPWSLNHNTSRPYNVVSKKAYRGANILLLWSCAAARGYRSNGWVTFNQARTLGGSVCKGERGTDVMFYKRYKLQKDADTGESQLIHDDEPDPNAFLVTDPEDQGCVYRLFARTYKVFNVDQTTGLPARFYEPPSEPPVKDLTILVRGRQDPLLTEVHQLADRYCQRESLRLTLGGSSMKEPRCRRVFERVGVRSAKEEELVRPAREGLLGAGGGPA